jgi:hypothetical protein
MRSATGEIPEALSDRTLPLGAYPLKAQFGQAIFETETDAFVLSIQPDLQITMARHRQDRFVFHPNNFDQWPEADREWLRREFEPGADPPDVHASMANLEAVVERLRAGSSAPILVYNVSSVVPGETVHCHAGMADILSTRIKRFNLALVELSQRTGISIVDVDRIVARHGADAMKLDTTHLTEKGCRAVAEEVLRILEDFGCLSAEDVGHE